LSEPPDAGLIVDRHDKRHVLMVTNTVLGLTSLAIGAAVLTHTIAMWQIFTAATIFGVMTCLDNPARMAFVPELVGIALILPAVTTNSIMANVGRTLGPVVAAVLAHNFGLGWCFVANAASVALIVAALLALDVAAEIGWTIPLKRQRADVPPCRCSMSANLARK
jgi:MFS family permease